MRGFGFLVFSHKWGPASACRDRLFTYLCEKTKNPKPRTTESFQYFRVISTVFERHGRYIPGKKYIPENNILQHHFLCYAKNVVFLHTKTHVFMNFFVPMFALFRIGKQYGVGKYFFGYNLFFREDIYHEV